MYKKKERARAERQREIYKSLLRARVRMHATDFVPRFVCINSNVYIYAQERRATVCAVKFFVRHNCDTNI